MWKSVISLATCHRRRFKLVCNCSNEAIFRFSFVLMCSRTSCLPCWSSWMSIDLSLQPRYWHLQYRLCDSLRSSEEYSHVHASDWSYGSCRQDRSGDNSGGERTSANVSNNDQDLPTKETQTDHRQERRLLLDVDRLSECFGEILQSGTQETDQEEKEIKRSATRWGRVLDFLSHTMISLD